MAPERPGGSNVALVQGVALTARPATLTLA